MTSANLPADSKGDKQQVNAYLGEDERRLVALAAVESSVSRSTFIATAAVEKAVEVLKEKNPSALEGTPYALARSA